MCVQSLMIRYKIAIWFEWMDFPTQTWQMALQQKWCESFLDIGSALGIKTNSKAFPSQSHWLRCENSFQSLLTTDQSYQLVILGLLPWSDSRKSLNIVFLSRLLFCSLGPQIWSSLLDWRLTCERKCSHICHTKGQR